MVAMKYVIFTIIFAVSTAWCSLQEDDVDADDVSIEEYATRYPYPKTPIDMDWSYEMRTPPIDQPKVYAEINALLTELLERLSAGDPKKKRQLTVRHNWVPFRGTHCFDALRFMVSIYCVEWKLSEYVRRYAYLLVNMCNADWLNIEDIEEGMAQACHNKRIPDDKCA